MRRLMLENVKGGENMTEWKLIDTVTLTPSEKFKYIDFAPYKEKEFFIVGKIPKTKESTGFYVGVKGVNKIQTPTQCSTYSHEMIAHIQKIGDDIYGYCSFEHGWGTQRSIGGLIKTPRVTTPTTELDVGFYPYVAGDEQAVIKIYAR